MNYYKRKEACFVCSSPYQIISAISIAMSRNMKADLFIFGSFPNFVSVADNLKFYSIFSCVQAVDLDAIGVRDKWVRVKETLFAKTIVNRFLDKAVSYDQFYYSSRSSLKSAMLKVLLDRNPHMQQIVFDEGMGTYSDNGSLLAVTKSRRLLEKILHWSLDNPMKTTIMAYQPDLIHYEPPFNVCKIV